MIFFVLWGLNGEFGGGSVMKSALAFDPSKPRFLLGHALSQLSGGMPVANRDVALFPQGMVGEIKLG